MNVALRSFLVAGLTCTLLSACSGSESDSQTVGSAAENQTEVAESQELTPMVDPLELDCKASEPIILSLEEYRTSGVSGDRIEGWRQAPSDAAGVWPSIQDEDLKLAVKGLADTRLLGIDPDVDELLEVGASIENNAKTIVIICSAYYGDAYGFYAQ